MKKLFLLIPALVLALMTTNATTHEIGSGTSNILGATVSAASDGDIIILTDNGPYVNVYGVDYTKLEKNLTIKAAEGKNPVIKYEVPFRSKLGKTVKFIGITFDGTSLSSYDFYFRFYDANNNNLEFENCEFKNISKYVFDVYTAHKANSLKLTNCKLHDNSSRGILNRGTLTNLEINGGQIYNFTGASVLENYDGATIGKVKINGTEFYGNKKDIIYGTATSQADSCIINNCYFHDNDYSAIYFNKSSAEGKQTIYGLKVTNSTFANNDPSKEYRALIDVQSYNREATDDIEVVVDHCTFYNNTTMNHDYSAIRTRVANRTTVSNCIFAHPSAIEFYATNVHAGSVTNCLAYNFNKGYSAPTKTNANIGDPLFTDAANGDFSYSGNWVTMELSPARGAGTDGSDLGDPRWYSAETLPSTNFASGYQFVGAKAQISGNLWYDGENEFLYYNNKSENGVATWKINATRACILEATLNMNAETTTGHKFKVEVLDADGNSIGETTEPSQVSTAGDIVLPNQITLPAAGKYTVKLYNLTAWSSAKIDGVTFSYVGGDVQAMPGTTDIDDAWFSSNGTRTAGEYISIPSGHQHEGWVKWNVAFASAGNFNVTVNLDNANGHNYTVALYRSDSDESPITISEGGQKSTIGTIALGAMEVPAGNYIMKVTNATQYSDAKLISVTFAYAGGGVIEFGKATAASLLANADAIVSDDWSIEGGKITHAESKALTGWAKWNVDCADYGNYNVTVNISSDNGHLVRVEIFENESESAIYTLDETSSTQYHTGDQAIDLGNIVLDDREYVVKVSNTGAYSHVQIASIVITYQNGAKQSIPGSLTLTDAILSEKAYIESSMLYFAPHDCGTIPDEWAKWNLSVAGAGVYQFTVNVTSPNGQKYQILIEDNGGNEVYNLVQTSSLGTGDKSFTTGMIYMESGNYTLEMRNVYQYSDGHLVSISAAAVANVLTIDENATDNTVIHNNYQNGTHTIHLIRTITSGMYNTICLPFDVSSAQLQATYGADVELLQMESASLSGDELTLAFTDALEGGIYRGTPYLIKTTKTISNPVFTDVEIKAEAGSTTAGTGADFIGTFIKNTIDASEYNLFLGSSNTLYFSNNDVTLKGMRAYFRVKDNGSGAPVRRARIVAQNNVVTELELINGEWQDMKSVNGIIKTIENGQLILILDGKRYNVMGIRF